MTQYWFHRMLNITLLVSLFCDNKFSSLLENMCFAENRSTVNTHRSQPLDHKAWCSNRAWNERHHKSGD